AQAWDGAWYRRAYFDDGSPLGSKESDEAKIDSLPQSWAVISGAADPQRAAQALRSADEYLVREADGLILLFTPPFEHSDLNPGYIKGYPAGVRENGGQYTHGALWLAMAFARQGDGDRAVELLRLLNPVEHARQPQAITRYKVEPYVVAADVYALEGHVGRGGWTWYTGSSGWMYRVWIEEVLGLKLNGDRLHFDPRIPAAWDDLKVRYRCGATFYNVTIQNPDRVNRGVVRLEIDGQVSPQREIVLRDDGVPHTVVVRLGAPSPMVSPDTAAPPFAAGGAPGPSVASIEAPSSDGLGPPRLSTVRTPDGRSRAHGVPGEPGVPPGARQGGPPNGQPSGPASDALQGGAPLGDPDNAPGDAKPLGDRPLGGSASGPAGDVLPLPDAGETRVD
ncbi:MAG: hypothetical protein M3442_17895, partial [Chloroflexota bacterium]|nr:hypothetical protein [Chloroflexota bacterium]